MTSDAGSTSAQAANPNGPPGTDAGVRVHWAVTAVAAALPPLFAGGGVFALLLLAAAMDRRVSEEVSRAGPFFMVVVLLVAAATAGCAVLLALAGRGRRVPDWTVVAMACLPWIGGAVGTMLGNQRVMQVVASMGLVGDGAVAAGLGEALVVRMLGTFFSCLLLAAVGLAWSVLALALRAPGRRMAGLLVGAGSALPLPVLVMVLMVAGGLGPAGALALLAGFAVVLVLAVAGLGAGSDLPRARSAAGAPATAVAMGLAFVAMAAFVHVLAGTRVLDQVAMLGPDSLGLLSSDLRHLGGASLLHLLGAVLALLPVLAMMLWARARARPHTLPLGGVVLCLLVAAATLGLDIVAGQPSSRLLNELATGQRPGPAALADQDREPVAADEPDRIPVPDESLDEPDEGIELFGDEILGLPDSGAADGGTLRVGGDILPPRRIDGPAPSYPADARRARIQGIVVLEAVISKEGRVESVRILKGLPMGLDEEAAKAVKQWRFEPATLHGEPVEVFFTLSVRFEIS